MAALEILTDTITSKRPHIRAGVITEYTDIKENKNEYAEMATLSNNLFYSWYITIKLIKTELALESLAPKKRRNSKKYIFKGYKSQHLIYNHSLNDPHQSTDEIVKSVDKLYLYKMCLELLEKCTDYNTYDNIMNRKYSSTDEFIIYHCELCNNLIGNRLFNSPNKSTNTIINRCITDVRNYMSVFE